MFGHFSGVWWFCSWGSVITTTTGNWGRAVQGLDFMYWNRCRKWVGWDADAYADAGYIAMVAICMQ
jgi:hypothetical protein